MNNFEKGAASNGLISTKKIGNEEYSGWLESLQNFNPRHLLSDKPNKI